MARKFEIIEKDWYKRRTILGKDIKPVHVAIPDYQPVHNYICNMIVSYDDDSLKTLIARVLYNELTSKWTVDGMEVSVMVIEMSNENAGDMFNRQVG
ncbi:hypothetical protein Q4489_17830 [Thalassotalea sp. 1_MG-2023]|uniref:hypothetical protein n=1 Tax=Thalassotalea sp. 1_MG-2023 TaxID=3062680 RepID=UPI0026E3FE47|nr:hypothetical protein [Thalassotalea sp. 1_MG-2023]MDO6428869.1 hypothetical protein [Thalassotalea sp. 1_MG-2023]